MATCPNKNSKEWKEILSEAQNNEQIAMDLWIKKGFNQQEDLNEDAKEGDLTNEEIEALQELDPMQRLAQKTKVYLQKRINILSNQKVKDVDRKTNRLKELLQNMKAVEEVESINLFIEEAYKMSQQLKQRTKQFLIDVKKEDVDRKELIEALTNINEYANSYNILDEISSEDLFDFFQLDEDAEQKMFEEDEEGNVKLSMKEKLERAVTTRNIIRQRMLDEGIPLLAEFLLDARSKYSAEGLEKEIAAKRAEIEKIKNDVTNEKRRDRLIQKVERQIDLLSTKAQDKDGMIKILKEAAIEEGVLDFLVGPLISSPDSAVALFAKAIKDQLEFARLKDINIKRELTDEYLEYRSQAPGSTDNPQKFNEGLYTVVEVPVYETVQSKKNPNYYYKTVKKDEAGNIVYKKEVHFVERIDRKKFKAAQAQWWAENPKPHADKIPEQLTSSEKQDVRNWENKKKQWYKENMTEKSAEAIKAIDDKMKNERDAEIISKKQYANWFNNERFKEIQEPSSKYISEKWLAMYNKDGKPKNAMGEYHKALTDTYYGAQELLPESQRTGSRIPSIPKKDLERLLDEGISNLVKTNIKETISIQAYDTEYGGNIATLGGEAVKFLPIFFTQNIDESDISYDLLSSVLLFSQMANKYDALNEVNGEISLMKQVISKRANPKFDEVSGKKQFDVVAKRFGLEEFIVKSGESFTKKHLDAFIDMIVYGEMQKKEVLLGLQFDKITNTITGFSALTSIAADLLKGVANNLQGNIQLIIEASGAEFFSAADLAKSKVQFMENVAGTLGDFGKPSPTSWMGRLNELYDPIQGDFTDKYGRIVSASVANKLFRTNTLFFNQYFGEYEIQVSGMLALMNATEVRDKENGTNITMYEAHKKYGPDSGDLNGKVEWITQDKDGNNVYEDFNEKHRRSFQDRVHALSKKMHGIYNTFDKGTAQKQSLGRLALMYRKHMYPGFKRRWKQYSWDEELGSGTEGHYRTFWNTFVRDLRTYKLNVAKEWSTYTPMQKANIRRTLSEIGVFLTIVGLIGILSAMASDDGEDKEKYKDNYLYNFLLYEMVRMRSETAQYISPKDMWRTIKSPSAALSTLSRFIRFTNQILPWNITEEYKRKSGIWEKGDNKAWAYFIKLIGLPGYNIKPQDAVKVYENLSRAI